MSALAAEAVVRHSAGPSDDELLRRVRAGDTGLFGVLVRRYDRRLYLVARAILRDHAEAEDVRQHACVAAFVHLRQYAGRSSFSTWLTRIAVHEALADLPEHCQEILDRFFCRDESYQTIGSALDIPAGTIASRISRCLAKLREMFEGRKPDPEPS